MTKRDTPFVDLRAQYERVSAAVDQRIATVLQHGRYIMGPEVAELEGQLAEYVGVDHAVGCSSGTDALLLALMALGVGPGDAVFTTPFTFIATAEVISLLGATPVFVDIDPRTWNLDPQRLADAITALEQGDPALHPLPAGFEGLRPRGVIAVDLYGLPADYQAIQELCSARGLFLVEDAAQSFGAQYRGRRAGSFGDAAATSFFPAKPLGGYGDGGMVFTRDPALAEAMRSLRVHGKGRDKYDNVRVGLNARLDTLQAAIVLAKFEVFEDELAHRQSVAAEYRDALAPCEPLGLVNPEAPPGSVSAWAQYTVRITTGVRDELQRHLGDRGIPSVVYYPRPLHLQPAFAALGYSEGAFPRAERSADELLSVPFGPYLKDVRRVGRILADALTSVSPR